MPLEYPYHTQDYRPCKILGTIILPWEGYVCVEFKNGKGRIIATEDLIKIELKHETPDRDVGSLSDRLTKEVWIDGGLG